MTPVPDPDVNFGIKGEVGNFFSDYKNILVLVDWYLHLIK